MKPVSGTAMKMHDGQDQDPISVMLIQNCKRVAMDKAALDPGIDEWPDAGKGENPVDRQKHFLLKNHVRGLVGSRYNNRQTV